MLDFIQMLVSGIAHAWTQPYRDIPDRRELVYAPGTHFLSTGRTNAARAALVDDLVRHLEGVVAPGDELLIHGSCPLLHVVTKTRPALGVTWPAVYSLNVFNAF